MAQTSNQPWNIPLWAGEAQNVDRIVREADRILCATSPVQWSYAIVFKVPVALRSRKSNLIVEFDMDVISGRIGLGALEGDSMDFIAGMDEELCEPGVGIVPSLSIPETAAPDLAMLVIRNTAPGNTISEFVVRSISVRTNS
jgi:hypothetical protein